MLGSTGLSEARPASRRKKKSYFLFLLCISCLFHIPLSKLQMGIAKFSPTKRTLRVTYMIPPEKGKGTRYPEQIGSMGGGRGEGVKRKRKGAEEGRGGYEGAGSLSRGKNRGEQEKRYHTRGSHYRFKEKSGTKEMSRDLQG